MMLPMSTAPAVRPRRQSNSSFRDRTRRLAALVIPIRTCALEIQYEVTTKDRMMLHAITFLKARWQFLSLLLAMSTLM